MWSSAPASAASPSSIAVYARPVPPSFGCIDRCCTASTGWNKRCAFPLRPPPLAGLALPDRFPGGRVVELSYRHSPQEAALFEQTLLALPVASWWEDWMSHASLPVSGSVARRS